MGKVASKGTRIWVDHLDLSGDLNASQLDVKQQNPSIGTFADEGPRRLSDGYDHSTSHNGFFDNLENAVDQKVFEMLGADTDHYIAQLFGANVEGSLVYESIEKISGEPRSVKKGEAILLNLTAEGSGQLARGILLRNGTVSGVENGTGYNQGATTLGQVYAATFRIFSGVFTHCTLKVQHSNDNGGVDPWADIATLTSGDMTAAGVVRVSTTAATKAWKRVVVEAFTGASAVIGVTGTVEAAN